MHWIDRQYNTTNVLLKANNEEDMSGHGKTTVSTSAEQLTDYKYGSLDRIGDLRLGYGSLSGYLQCQSWNNHNDVRWIPVVIDAMSGYDHVLDVIWLMGTNLPEILLDCDGGCGGGYIGPFGSWKCKILMIKICTSVYHVSIIIWWIMILMK